MECECSRGETWTPHTGGNHVYELFIVCLSIVYLVLLLLVRTALYDSTIKYRNEMV